MFSQAGRKLYPCRAELGGVDQDFVQPDRLVQGGEIPLQRSDLRVVLLLKLLMRRLALLAAFHGHVEKSGDGAAAFDEPGQRGGMREDMGRRVWSPSPII
jgi:hypothetical protein